MLYIQTHTDQCNSAKSLYKGEGCCPLSTPDVDLSDYSSIVGVGDRLRITPENVLPTPYDRTVVMDHTYLLSKTLQLVSYGGLSSYGAMGSSSSGLPQSTDALIADTFKDMDTLPSAAAYSIRNSYMLGTGQDSFKQRYDGNTYTQITSDIPGEQQFPKDDPNPGFVCHWDYGTGMYAADYVDPITKKFKITGKDQSEYQDVVQMILEERYTGYPSFLPSLTPFSENGLKIDNARLLFPNYITDLHSGATFENRSKYTKVLVPHSKYYAINGMYNLTSSGLQEMKDNMDAYIAALRVDGLLNLYRVQEDKSCNMCGDSSLLWIEEFETKENYDVASMNFNIAFWKRFTGTSSSEDLEYLKTLSTSSHWDTDGVRDFMDGFKKAWISKSPSYNSITDSLGNPLEPVGEHGTFKYNYQSPSILPRDGERASVSVTNDRLLIQYMNSGRSGEISAEGPVGISGEWNIASTIVVH